MTEIEVIKTKSEEKRETVFESLEEIKVIYDNIAKSSDLPKEYFNEFVRLEEDEIKEETASTKPEIEFLLLRKIMDHANVIPIVKTFYRPLINVEDIVKAMDLQESVFVPIHTGGLEPRKREKSGKPKPKPKSPAATAASPFAIDVRVSQVKQAIFLKDLQNGYMNTYQIGPGQMIDVCGFLLYDKKPLFEYYLQKVPGNMDITGRLLSGAWSSNYVHYQFLQPLNYAGRFSSLLMQTPHNILFVNAEHMKMVSNAICDYLTYMYLEKVYSKPSDYILLALQKAQITGKTSSIYKWLTAAVSSDVLSPAQSPVQKVSKYKPRTFSPVMLTFMSTIAKHFPAQFDTNFYSAFWEDILSLKLMNLAEKVQYTKLSGKAGEKVKREIEEIMSKADTKNSILTAQAKANEQYLGQSLKELRYRWIYLRRFGEERLDEVLAKLPHYNLTKVNKLRLFGSIMNYIGKKEQKLIEEESRRLEKIDEAIKASESMPWAAIYSKIRYTTNIQKRDKLFEELRKYLPKDYKTNKKDWIRSSKGIPIICPHIVELNEMRSNHATDNQIQSTLSKYADEVPIFQAFYCKICGEKLYSPIEMESGISIEGEETFTESVDSELRDWMWKNVSYVVRNNIEFAQLISDRAKNKFISNIVDNLYEIIYLIEKKISAVKTNTRYIIDSKKKIFTTIYTWAFLIKLVSENKDKIHFTSPKKLVKPKDMFIYARNRMMNSLNVVFANIPDMELTETFIDNSLHKAYQSLLSYFSKSKIRDFESSDIMNILIHDPVYNYIAFMRGWTTLLHAHFGSGSGSTGVGVQAVSGVRTIMNRALTPDVVIGKTKAQVENINGPPLFKSLASVKFPVYKAHDTAKGKSRMHRFIEIRKEAYSRIVAGAIDFLLYYVQGKSYLDSGYIVEITRQGSSFKIVTYSKDVQKDLDTRSEKIISDENAILHVINYFYARAYSLSPYDHNRRFAKSQPGANALARVFGYAVNDGKETKLFRDSVKNAYDKSKNVFHRHKWDICIYVAVDAYQPEKALTEYKNDEVFIMFAKEASKFYGDSFVNNPLTLKYKYVGSMCRVCFHEYRNTEERIKDIKKHAEREDDMINFYRFFGFQCPTPSKDQLAQGEKSHVYKKSSSSSPSSSSSLFGVKELDLDRKCVNCGFQKSFVVDKNTDYYKKYITAYAKERKTENKESRAMLSNTEPKSTAIKIAPVIKAWKPRNTVTNELADATFDLVEKGSSLSGGMKAMKINKREYLNLISNLGLFERVDYDDIIKGKESPYKSLTPQSAEARTNSLGSFIHEIIFDYTALVNYDNITKPSLEMKELINSGKPADLAALKQFPSADELTPLKMNYYRAYEQMCEYNNTDNSSIIIAQFQMYYLCSMLLGINQIVNKLKMDKTFSRDVLLYFLNRIIAAEKVFSAAKAARMAALEAIQAAQGVDVFNDANNIDNRQSRMYDDLIDADYEDNFSFAGMDYDGTNDDINT